MPASKEFEEYLTKRTLSPTLNDYAKSPATAFLKFAVDTKNALDRVRRHFPKKRGGYFREEAGLSYQIITMAMLASIMSHFETFEKFLFAGVTEYSQWIPNFQEKCFIKDLSKQSNINLDLDRLMAWRGAPVSVGAVLADSLYSWHNPEKVNAYFRALIERQPFSNDNCEKLRTLWQIRHSIVHTAGVLTLPDAQKVSPLHSYGGKSLTTTRYFILEVVRKLHPIVRDATAQVRDGFDAQDPDIPIDKKSIVDEFFTVHSSVSVWLRP
jgi:hypothetical protein